jgi:hypothetical protein
VYIYSRSTSSNLLPLLASYHIHQTLAQCTCCSHNVVVVDGSPPCSSNCRSSRTHVNVVCSSNSAHTLLLMCAPFAGSPPGSSNCSSASTLSMMCAPSAGSPPAQATLQPHVGQPTSSSNSATTCWSAHQLKQLCYRTSPPQLWTPSPMLASRDLVRCQSHWSTELGCPSHNTSPSRYSSPPCSKNSRGH